MSTEQLRAVHQAIPFKPFTIHVADGRSFRVPHREFLSLSPGGRTLFVFHDEEAFSILDLLLVTELEVRNGAAAQRRRRGKVQLM
jgi:hypothetical protein